MSVAIIGSGQTGQSIQPRAMHLPTPVVSRCGTPRGWVQPANNAMLAPNHGPCRVVIADVDQRHNQGHAATTACLLLD